MARPSLNDAFSVTAPTRVDLSGGTLDLWPLYCLMGSSKTINAAINLNAVCRFHVAPHSVTKVEFKHASGESFLLYEPLLGEALATVPKELRFPVAIVSRYLLSTSKVKNLALQIEIETRAPIGSGLGGSSTLCVALLRGLGRVFGDFQEQGWQWKMLDWVRDVEAEYLKTPTGTQDYLAALFGSLSCFSYEIGGIGYQPYSPELVKGLNEHLVVLFSGEMHQSGLSNWEVYKKAIEGDEKVLSGFRQIRDLTETLHADLSSTDLSWKRVGQHLNEEWRIRKSTFGVHTPRLDELIGFLQSKKVFGAKVCGAAQGGSLIALVDPKLKARLIDECESEGIQVLPAEISPQGVTMETLS